jgi:hypothetical protein
MRTLGGGGITSVRRLKVSFRLLLGSSAMYAKLNCTAWQKQQQNSTQSQKLAGNRNALLVLCDVGKAELHRTARTTEQHTSQQLAGNRNALLVLCDVGKAELQRSNKIS